jgi:uncharacterized protein (TIGR02145 family)
MLASGSTMPADPAPTLNDPDTVSKWCYDNSSANCTAEGGLYTWAEANALADTCNSTSCSVSTPNQGICPAGWHIPTDTEYKTMEEYLGMCSGTGAGCSGAMGLRGTDQGSKLSMFTSGGNNSSGFTALLAGGRYTDSNFINRTSFSSFWSSSPYDFWAGAAWNRGLFPDSTSVYRAPNNMKGNGYSVRCLKNPDAAQPAITGVTNGSTYFTSVSPVTANGTATLNGNAYTSGTPITQNGTYTLIVDNGQGSTASATFTLIVSKTVIDPNSTKLNADYGLGIITVAGGNATATTEATINTNYTLVSGGSSMAIPSGTIVTPASGTIDITSLNTEDISAAISQLNSNSKGAIRIGIPSHNLTFSQAITVSMDVHPSYNGKALTIYSRPDSGGDWAYHGSCNVSGSKCAFTTTHATEYTGNYEVSNSPSPLDTNLDIDATISIDCDDSVSMGTITGTGQSDLTTNEADCSVKTINSGGYSLSWSASAPYMENAEGHQILPYAGSDNLWSISASDSAWGARVKSTSTDPDIVGAGIWDGTDTYNGNWKDVPSGSEIVATKTDHTTQEGSNETIIFGAEIGSNKWQPTGIYATDVTLTATAL